MHIQVLGCSGGSARARHLTSFQFDDDFVVDAGSVTTALEVEDQRRVPAVVISHAHMDHVWSLPLFLSNRFSPGVGTCKIYGSAFTLTAIQENLFDGRIWPDFSDLEHEGRPVLQWCPIEADRAFDVGRYHLTPVEMDHTVPCRGYLVDDGDDQFLVTSDTGPTEAAWQLANEATRLRGVIVECSFPDSYGELAHQSRHLTPTTLAGELRKLRQDVPVYITHMKPGYEADVLAALKDVADPRLRVLEAGMAIQV